MSKPIGPYSPIMRAGELLFSSGQLGVLPAPDGSPQLVEGGTGAQLAEALRNADALLPSEGASRSQVIKATVFVIDMGDFAQVNEVMAQYCPQPFPARAAVGAAALPKDALVEADAILVLDQGRVLDLAPHHELIARCPVYQQLWNQQNRHMLAAAE